ncbi:SIS domain-containing protein, partial [Mesorhizobium sp. M7D.F.Ca.US.004.03.1.1]
MSKSYLASAIEILQQVEATQSDKIRTAAGWIADAIEADGLA